MSKPKTKQDLVQALTKADILEFAVETVNRKDQPSVKKSKEAGFIRQVQSYIASERDILLVAIKIR